MLDAYHQLIESFKAHQISVLLNTIREKIVSTLNTDYFSNHIKDYFTDIDCCSLLVAQTTPIIGSLLPFALKKAYIITNDIQLNYFDSTNNTLTKIDITDEVLCTLKKSLGFDDNKIILTTKCSIKIIKSMLTKLERDTITIATKHCHLEQQPFVDFAHQPKQIIQIKETINALFYAQLAFFDLENINSNQPTQVLSEFYKLYNNTIECAYKASYLLTHLEFDLADRFSEELTYLLQLSVEIKNAANECTKNPQELTTMIRDYSIDHKKEISVNIGLFAGIATAQTRPGVGHTIPLKYIQELTTGIKKNCRKINNYDANLDKEKIANLEKKIDDLEKKVVKLLESLNTIQSNNFFVTLFKSISYIKIINEIIDLSTTILKQVINLGEKSQDIARDNLKKLKYDLFANLFILIDKIEDETLLAPGTLSKPLMDVLSPYYQLLITHIENVLDLHSKGKHLLILDDNEFAENRIQAIQARINDTEAALFKVQKIKLACINFFLLLKNETKSPITHLTNLPTLTKEKLIVYYLHIQSYVEKLRIDLSNEIVIGLKSMPYATDALRNTYLWLIGNATDNITDIINIENDISNMLDSEIATYQLHIQLNNDLTKTICEGLTLLLCPIKTNNLGSVDFDKAFKLELTQCPDFINRLTAEQTYYSYRKHTQYERHLSRIATSSRAFQDIINTHPTIPLYRLHPVTKNSLRGHYTIFQFYFIDRLVSNGENTRAHLLDETIIATLTTPYNALKQPKHCVYAKELNEDLFEFNQSIDKAKKVAQNCRNSYEAVINNKHSKDMTIKELVVNNSDSKRANYLIKHTKCSEEILKFRNSLYQSINLFNQSVRNQLKHDSSGCPFPELEEPTVFLEHNKQILILKQLINSLYHLEQIFSQLEKLNNNSYQTTYVRHLINGYYHINVLQTLVYNLGENVYLSLIKCNLMNNFLSMKQALLEYSQPYVNNAVTANDGNASNDIQSPSLWYPLKIISLIPQHIDALMAKKNITQEQLTIIHNDTKQVMDNINTVITSSHSYFKLLLQVPMIYALFKNLKQKLTSFTEFSYDVVMTHLREINTNILTEILLETDRWEDKLYLRPGQLSGDMKTILDQFYQGLLKPLKLEFKKHIALVTDLNAFDRRLTAISIQKKEILAKKATICPELMLLKTFQDMLQAYFSLTGGLIPASTISIAIRRNELIEAYKTVYPILLKEHARQGYSWHLMYQKEPCDKQIETNKFYLYLSSNNTLECALRDTTGRVIRFKLATIASENSSSTTQPIAGQLTATDNDIIKALLNKGVGQLAPSQKNILTHTMTTLGFSVRHTCPINNHLAIDKIIHEAIPSLPPLTNIVGLSMFVYSFYQGLNANFQLDYESAQGKIEYLETLKKEQLKKNNQFIINLIKDEFDRAISKHTKLKSLYFAKEEYTHKLQTKLEENKCQFIEKVGVIFEVNGHKAYDIKNIESLISEKTKTFHKCYLENYKQLDTILAILDEFDSYFKKTRRKIVKNKLSIYEDDHTLTLKEKSINRLNLIARDHTISIEERIKKLRREVDKNTDFQKNIFAQRELTIFSCDGLVRCFLSLLTVLKLYTPQHINYYYQLTNATSYTFFSQKIDPNKVTDADNPMILGSTVTCQA